MTGRHPIRSGTQTVPITGGPDGLTRWEITIAQALSEEIPVMTCDEKFSLYKGLKVLW